jgi:hypothetical protein
MSNLQLSFIFFMRLESFLSCTFLPVSKARTNRLCIVAYINNYSTLSEERHKKISNILSNTETNRNALVPVQFSANLPRKTSANSTGSSTSDVSCRSNPNVSSYCANTNMSSEISSMFYGAVLHVNTLNVNLYTNPHN